MIKRTSFVATVVRSTPPLYRGGPLTLEPDAYFRALLLNCLHDLDPKSPRVQVTLEPEPDMQTDAQRRFFHKLCDIYGKAHNSTKEDVKWMAKCEFGITRQVTVEGESYLWVKSTSEYSKEEYTALIDRFIGHMAEDGIDIDSEVLEWRGMKKA